MYYSTLIISHFTGFWKQTCVNRPKKCVNEGEPVCWHAKASTFFVDKAAACYYNNVVKMAFLCGFAAAQHK